MILKEAVPGLRWAGIALVIGGVILIGLSETRRPGRGTAREHREEPECHLPS